MLEIRYVQLEDKEFWYSLDRHLSEQEFNNKISDKRGYVLLDDNNPIGLLRYNLFWDNTPFCTMLFVDWNYHYTLFPEHPEFFSTYRLINQRTGQLYSSKFQISEVDLTLRNQATEEDIAQHRDLWAAFFKATEWGELMALANKDSNINEAVVTLKKLTEDELFKMRYQAREDQFRQQWDMEYYYNTKFAEMEEQMSDMAEQNIIKDERIAELEAQLKELQSK